MSAYTVLDGDTVQIEGRHFAGNRFTQAANSSKEIWAPEGFWTCPILTYLSRAAITKSESEH